MHNISSSATSKFSCETASLKPSMSLRPARVYTFPAPWHSAYIQSIGLDVTLEWETSQELHVMVTCPGSSTMTVTGRNIQNTCICERLDYDSKQTDHLARGAWLLCWGQVCKEKAVRFWVCNDKHLVCIRQRGWTDHHRRLQTGLWGW